MVSKMNDITFIFTVLNVILKRFIYKTMLSNCLGCKKIKIK